MTKTVRLIPLDSAGSELLRIWRNYDRRFFVDTSYISRNKQAAWYHHLQRDPHQKMYLITYRHHPIGAIGLKLTDPHNPELGPYILGDKRYSRQGLMQAAILKLFQLHPAPRYHGIVKKNNPAGLALDQKVGFVITHQDRQFWYIERQSPLSPDHPPMIPLLKPSCSATEILAVTQVLKSGWWGLGPVTSQLETEFAQAVKVKHAVTLNSATAALHLAVKILKGQRHTGNIVTTALTFASTAAAGLYEGLKIRFADIDPTTLCLDPHQAAKLIDKNTIAVIPVHYAGNLAATDYGHTPVIEDCAHAAGHPQAGCHGTIACWSFHPVKNIATGDGGMLTTNDPTIAQQAKELRWLGITQDTWSRESGGYNWEYQISQLGYKYHANDILSAIALAQLHRLKSLNFKRRRIAARYTRHLAGLPIMLPPPSGTWHLYVIRLNNPQLRHSFIDYLRRHGISAGVHYQPLHHYPIFKWNKPLPVTDRVFSQIVDLPIFPDLTIKQQNYIIKTINCFFTKANSKVKVNNSKPQLKCQNQ